MLLFKRLFNLMVFGLCVDDGTGNIENTKPNPPKDPPQDPPADPPADPGKIPYDRFKKVNDENRGLKEQIAQIEKDKEAAKKAELESQGKWQEAAESADKRATEAEKKAADLEKTHLNKMREYEIGLEAKAQGINDIKDAVQLIDQNDITVNDDGSLSGIKEAVEKLKNDKPYLFGDENAAPGVHKNKPKGGTNMSKSELLADPDAAQDLIEKNPAEYDRIMGRKPKT